MSEIVTNKINFFPTRSQFPMKIQPLASVLSQILTTLASTN